MLELVKERLFEFLLFDLRPFFSPASILSRLTVARNTRSLLAAHDRNARVRPSEQKTWAICPSTHAVVSRTVRAADNHRDLRHARARNGRHHLGTVFRNPAGLIVSSNHEPDDILQEQQRNASLTAKLNKMRCLQGAF